MIPVPDILAEPWRHDLFAVLRDQERRSAGKPRIGRSATRADEFVILSQDPFLEFAPSTIAAAAADPKGRLRLTLRFLGLFGPQGALPLTTTEEAYGWLLARDEAFARFLDVVQSRFLQLFYRAWADPRPVAQNDRPADDRFVAYIGATLGIGTPPFQGTDSLSRFARLEFAGLLGPEVRSATRLEQLIAGLFDVRVEVEQFRGIWLLFDEADRSRVGQRHATLGRDTMVGASAFTLDKIRIRIFVRDLEQYRRFLPGGAVARQVADAVFLFSGDEVDWDVELAIPGDKVQPVTLGGGARLGWTGWMAPKLDPEEVRTDTRFHLAERLAEDRRSPAGDGHHG